MDQQDPNASTSTTSTGQSSSSVSQDSPSVPIPVGYYGAPPPPGYSHPSLQHHPHQALSYPYPTTAHAYGNRYDPSFGGYDAGPSSLPIKLELERASSSPSRIGTASPGEIGSGGGGPVMRRIGGKANVSSACAPCKKAHLACDVSRPCKRCVNMGKEALCTDVPHKKRGRPKSIKPPLSEPYARIRPPLEGGLRGWRSEGPTYENSPYSYAYSADPPISYPLSRSLTDPEVDSWSSPAAPFTVFTTTEWKVLRISPACFHFTGYHPHAFMNLNLLDWFMPADRSAIDIDREHLISPTPYAAPIKTDREVAHAITPYSERDLLSPAEGMREPYPNQNVRVLRSDNQYSLFNVRLHLGGGLGGSLYRPETMGRIYLVVSLLLISNHVDRDRGPPGMQDDRRPAQYANPHPHPHPPTPTTAIPTTAMPASSSPAMLPHSASAPSLHSGAGGLPSFSSMAAAADGPSPIAVGRYDQSASGGGGYYAAAPRSLPSGAYDYRGQHPPPPPPGGAYPPRSPSPYSPHPAQRSVTGPSGLSIATTGPPPPVYLSNPQEYPTPHSAHSGSPYYDPRTAQGQQSHGGGGGGEYRRLEDAWDRRRIVSQPNLTPSLAPAMHPGQPGHSPTTAASISPVQAVQTPTTAQLPHPPTTPGSASQDYGRRTWEL